MFTFLITLLALLFAAMLFVNVYFRSRVLKAYRVLARNGVEFEATHVFQARKLREEVIPRYPEYEKEILDFAENLKRSIRMGTILLVLITLVGGVLMYYR